MNSLRPQGYGNILMMMYLGKAVYLNTKNRSVKDLYRAGLEWFPIEALKSPVPLPLGCKDIVLGFLSHDRLVREYREMF
jgi:hypothetical protein